MQGVLFDLDGILTDTAKFHFAAWSRLAQEKLGINLPASFESELKGVSRVDSLVRIMDFTHITNQYTKEQIEQLANEKNDYYVKAISNLTQADILPGITVLLQELAEKKVACAIASASKNAPLILEKLGLTAYFAATVDPAQVAQGKPAPDIFIAAAHALGLEPEQCVGVEDAVAGVAAINAAGAVAVGVGTKEELGAAELVVASTAELNAALLERAYQAAQKK